MRPDARVASIALALLALGAGLAWLVVRERTPSATTAESVEVDAAQVDPANEGRRISIRGALRVVEPPRDADLGVEANDALALLREVEMLQWRETCEGRDCRHRLEWSSEPVDSGSFREPEGHANPASMPFTAARFEAGEVRIGAFQVDPASVAEGIDAVAWPADVAQLPPNLAATFRDCDGAICTGEQDAPAAGDVRVRYRVVPAGTRTLDGVQRGDRIEVGGTR